jgi:hypothetical protein
MCEQVEVMLWNESIQFAVAPIRPNLDGRKSDEFQKFVRHRPQNDHQAESLRLNVPS